MMKTFFWFLLFAKLEKDFVLLLDVRRDCYLWQGCYNQSKSELFALFFKRSRISPFESLFLDVCLICKTCSKGFNVIQIGYSRTVKIIILHNWKMLYEPYVIISFLIYFYLFRVIDSSMKNFKAFFRWLYVGKLSKALKIVAVSI